jgi:hypothetical protein
MKDGKGIKEEEGEGKSPKVYINSTYILRGVTLV